MPNVNSAVVGETGHLSRRAGEPGRLVFFSGGGTPSSSQRLALRNAIDNRPMKTAVVTDSAMVRGIIGVFSLAELPALVDAARKMNDAMGGDVAVAELLKAT